MATWDDVRSWLARDHKGTQAGANIDVLMPRPAAGPMAIKVLAPSDDNLSIRVVTRILPVGECADREATKRLLEHGSFYEENGEYCLRATVSIRSLSQAGLLGALRHFAGTAGDVDRRLRRRPAPVVELSCFAGYAD
jgi:hypothetical protein